MNSFTIALPGAFSFELALSFLLRSPREVLHRIEDNSVIKALYAGDKKIVFRIQLKENLLRVDFLSGPVTEAEKSAVKDFIIEWFDLETDLLPFYEMVTRISYWESW